MGKALLVAALALAGCYTAPVPTVTSAQLDADFYQREAARQQWEAREAHLDRTCLAPPDTAWVNYCAQRERDKDRAARQAQWDRENQQAAALLDLQRKQLQEERSENNRRAAVDIQRAATAPFYGN